MTLQGAGSYRRPVGGPMRSPVDGQRVAMRVFVSREARTGWNEASTRFGTTVSALVEALGLIALRVMAGDIDVPPQGQAIIDQAKAIDADRRRRRP